MIDVSGNVQPCAYRGNYRNTQNVEPLGNINEQNLDDIWNGAVAQRLRRDMARGDLVSAGCGKCLAVAQGQSLMLEYDARAVDHEQTEYSKNLALKIDEIGAGETVCASRPTVLYYTPDHHCNLACVHCYQNMSRKHVISRTSANDELLGLAPYLTDLVAGGGEPLILPFWRRFLASEVRLTNPFLRFATATNATVLRDDVFQQISLFDRISIIISLDGATKNTFEAVRLKSHWETFLAKHTPVARFVFGKTYFLCLQHIDHESKPARNCL